VPVSKDGFRQAWSKFPTGVSIVISHLENGDPYCTTANAVCSISLEPLLVMLSITSNGTTNANILREGRFGLNFLAEGQSIMAIRYADNKGNKLRGIAGNHHVTPSGTTLLNNALASMDCRVVQQYGAGDHTLLIAEVEHLEMQPGAPLVFHEGHYTTVNMD
jgi:flavin reductase (DIM6/NTAB) family NADH-FMN oxidoreductase RutF